MVRTFSEDVSNVCLFDQIKPSLHLHAISSSESSTEGNVTLLRGPYWPRCSAAGTGAVR